MSSLFQYNTDIHETPELVIMPKQKYPLDDVLRLACAAQRVQKDYVREMRGIYDEEGKFLYYRYPNKILMQYALGAVGLESPPQPLKVIEEDAALAEEIKKYYRRLMFSAVEGSNEFQTDLNGLLNSDSIESSDFGFIACLPSIYQRDQLRNRIKKSMKDCEDRYLGEVDQVLKDKDCEIIDCTKSKNFEAYNVLAIIDNCVVSWFSKKPMEIGACVVVKAKIKGFGAHWQTKKHETRLNYVKAAQ